jgi:cytochrome c peroxidase
MSKAKVPNLPIVPYDYSFPNFLKSNSNRNNDNLIVKNYTNDVVTLGRVLFYDKQLSANGATACGTCHKQVFAFADNTATSKGFANESGTRNTPSIVNARFNFTFFWDSRTNNLEELCLQPIANHIEMGFEYLDALPKKLALLPYYPTLFKKAFGSDSITNTKIAIALANFLRSIISVDTKIDRSNIFNTPGNFFSNSSELSESEIRGSNLFNTKKCGNCHLNFGKNGVKNIGLDLVTKDIGAGLLGAEFSSNFTTPSLRNLSFTAPYMHDGRFATLEEVLSHYCCNVQNHPTISSPFKGFNNNVVNIEMSAAEKKDIISFLNALNDDRITKDVKYSDPFNY